MTPLERLKEELKNPNLDVYKWIKDALVIFKQREEMCNLHDDLEKLNLSADKLIDMIEHDDQTDTLLKETLRKSKAILKKYR